MGTSERSCAIVTGAGTGIGRATALLLAQRGWGVALAGRTRSTLDETRSLVETTTKGAAVVCACDVARDEDVRRLVETTMRSFGRVDALVNNAGAAPLVPIGETTPETLRASFGVNALGPGYAILAVWPVMAAQGGGRIVNVSTRGTADPFPGFFAYAGAKASVNTFAMSIAKEGEPHGIRGFSVAPGATETAMLREHWDEDALPRSRTQPAETVARVIVACAAGERDRDNGQTIFVVPP